MATLLDLVTDARRRLDDFGGDVEDPNCWMDDDSETRWSNAELADYFNRAQDEWARRVPIIDSTTAAVCQIAVTATTPTYALHNKILSVERVIRASDTKKLIKVFEVDNTHDPDFGDHLYYQHDLDSNTLRLLDTPLINDTLNMVVGRLPLNAMTWNGSDTTSAPELPYMAEPYDLTHWVLFLAYQKRNENTFNPELSGRHRKAFEARVGREHSNATMRRHRSLGDGPYRTIAYER